MPNRAAGGSGVSWYAALVAFTVAMSTILLQLVQTRIFGVVFWNHLVYFIISIALLGFGISGTLLTFSHRPLIRRLLSLPACAVMFTATALVSTLVMPQLGISLSNIFTGGQMARLIITYSAAVLPYFFGGWILGGLFRDNAKHMHFLYFSDLIGAALGCVVFVLGMQPLGAVVLLAACCALVAVPVLCWQARGAVRVILLVLVCGVLAYVCAERRLLNDRIVPEPTKAFTENWANLEPGDRKVVSLSEWNSISRIDVVSSEKRTDDIRIYIDGDAWTTGVVDPPDPPTPWDPDNEFMLGHALSYILHKDYENSLVIGSGGGIDVWQALRAGARLVDAVEINPTTWRVGLEEHRQVNNNLFHRPGVQAYNEEGRSFVRRTDKRYDLIMMKGIDTFAAINSGAYVLSENYLYTVDAMKDYISHLAPGGTLCIMRWRHPAESPRLFITALEALYALGVAEPERHILATAKKERVAVLVHAAPFSDDELARIEAHVRRYPEGDIFYPVRAGFGAGEEAAVYRDYAAKRAEGKQAEFFAAFPFAVEPVWDDSPFFFHFDKPSRMLAVFGEKDSGSLIRGHWPSFTLFALLGFTLLAVVLFMFLPLAAHGRGDTPHFLRWLTYFICLGVAFIFVEIALMQRFALLLGHPSRSLVLVLGALLFFAGLGSFLHERARLSLRVTLALLVLAILCCAFVYPAVIQAVLGYSLAMRAVVTLLLVAPLGLLMGMPFPAGIRRVSSYGDQAVPWMWGVNGGSTVLGSILAILFAIHGSFTVVLVLAAAGYALALALSGRLFAGD